MPLHLVTQHGLPQGQVRSNCEACGKVCGPFSAYNTKGHLWTEDSSEWSDAADNCLRVADSHPSLIGRRGELNDEQKVVYNSHVVHKRDIIDPDDEDEVRY